MRRAKVPGEVVYQKVWESLCKRMDSETHLVHPSWLKMMREIHVCRQQAHRRCHNRPEDPRPNRGRDSTPEGQQEVPSRILV